jgi:hypothetical protein
MSCSIEALESERELIAAVSSLSDGLATLADAVDGNAEHAFARINLLEVRFAAFERIAQSLGRVLDRLEQDRDADGWWRTGGPPPGGTPNA